MSRAAIGGSGGPSLLARVGRLLRPREPVVLRASFSAYGKLPIYKDFLRHGLTGREAQAFRQWLDLGFSRYWEADPAHRAHAIAAHGFSFEVPGSRRRLAGCLWGSHDQGELRQFPFTLFVALPPNLGRIATLAGLAQLARGASALRLKVAAAAGAQEFYQEARAARLELRLERETAALERLGGELAGITLGRFAASLYGEDGGGAGRGAELLSYLARQLPAGRSTDSAARGFAVRLPVSPLLPVLCQAQLWCAALGGHGPLNLLLPLAGASAGAASPAAPTAESGGISVFGRELRADDVLALHPEPRGYDRAEDLRREVPRQPEARPLPAGLLERPLSALLSPGALRALQG